MDRDPMMFTSDVSLPKDDKRAMRGNQITVGKLTGLKTHRNANYATKKGRGSKAWAVDAREVSVSFLVGYPKWKVRCSAAPSSLSKDTKVCLQEDSRDIQTGGNDARNCNGTG